MDSEVKNTKEEFEEMLRHFDIPYKEMKYDIYVLGKDTVVQLLGDRENLIGVEELQCLCSSRGSQGRLKP